MNDQMIQYQIEIVMIKKVASVETEVEKRRHRCCFTGHRPEKMQRAETEIQSDLECEICNAVFDGLNVFISGMARGVDIVAAETVLRLREVGWPVRLICASPYPGFENNWNECWRSRYRAVIGKADLVKYIRSQYSKDCFHARNEWLVDHSARVIAVYNGLSGGTRNTIEYALRQEVPVVRIEG